MNRNSRKFFAIALFMFLPLALSAESLIYQPSPMQGYDVWVGSTFNKTGVDDWRLQAGGWGDQYIFLTKFDLVGLPKNVDSAVLWMLPYSKGDSSSLVGLNAYVVTSTWCEKADSFHNCPGPVTWGSKPSASFAGYLDPPTIGYRYGIDFTGIYNAWKNGAYPNYGFEFRPAGTNNQFSQFYSSDYGIYKSYRPFLELHYTPTVTPLNLKMPLPGNKSWMVTTEIGGRDCASSYVDSYHTNGAYYAIDFVPKTSDGVYQTNVPIYAASSGWVSRAGNTSGNGNYVVIDSDSDLNESTGYSTFYLHMKDYPVVRRGDYVQQGNQLGIMGNTGISTGTHLHFEVRYNGSGWAEGPSAQEALTYVQMESKSLKSFMTECDASGNRTAYYLSTNRP